MNKQEILEYGLVVFNNESDKFERWLQKPHSCLKFTPKEMLETEDGLKQVKHCLDIIEYSLFT